MKRIIFALALAACLFGCTTSDDAQTNNPAKSRFKRTLSTDSRSKKLCRNLPRWDSTE
ncbi:MAG: hypothetical protein ACLUKN_10615 [Bacilli bacterium]